MQRDVLTVADPSVRSERTARRRVRPAYRRSPVVRRGLGLTGFVFAVGFYCLALTPSLLPRSWLLQGVVSGLTAAMGYAVGATVGALVRLVWRRPPARAMRLAWRVLFVVAPLLGLLFLALGTRWQQELRARVGLARLETYDIIRIVAVGVLTFVVLLLVARLLRLATRRLARLLGRFVPKPIAYAVGFLVVGYLFMGFLQDFLWSNAYSVLSETASLTNGATAPGVVRPISQMRSGSPGSEVPWSSMGRQGRSFVAASPSQQELGRFAGRLAAEPIRVYVGLDSAGSPEGRAQLVVRELERTGAFDRAVLGVVTATGTGWVDENATDALEFMYAGDTALVSMQYSYLPSWVSFMVDQSKVKAASSALISAIHERWAALPAASRPRLVLFGESLGSYGTESVYRDLQGMANGADGVLLVGPPFANPIWSELVDRRDPGSPVWSPVYHGGAAVRFAQTPSDLRSGTGPHPRVVYLQNSTDPIVWWNPELLLQPPEWLDLPRGPDVSPEMQWYPGVTFWQTLVDLAFATGVPAGHGHVYGSGVVDGWAALVPPPGWTNTDTARLRYFLDARPR